MSLVSAFRNGINSIAAEPALKEQAAVNLEAWLTHPDFAAYVPQLEWLIANANWSVLLDSFYQVLPFGTGGRRGAVGIGPNRMNLWTLGASVQGFHAIMSIFLMPMWLLSGSFFPGEGAGVLAWVSSP